MSSQLFRKKSLDKISSPDQLNDYMHVSNPGIWMVLMAVILILAGVCVWGVFGHLDTKVEAVGISEDGNVIGYVREDDIKDVKAGIPAYINGKEYTVQSVSDFPIELTDEQLIAAGNFESDRKVYTVRVETDLKNGIYKVEFITNRILPMSFVLN